METKHPIVLVVEDESLLRMTVVDYLSDSGCTVLEAGSGEEAVALIDGQDQRLDVVFTDIRLGGSLNGWDVAEILREHFPDVRVVYASGYSIEPRRDVMGSKFFNKPYRLHEILAAFTH